MGANIPDLPGITGLDLSVTLSMLNSWFSSWDFGSSFFDGSTINIGTL
jgi:hypothetical protein